MQDTDYINSTNYTDLETKVKELQSVLDDLTIQSNDSRRIRYADVDIKAEQIAGNILPDELYISQHLVDTNIRREQSPYVQYITQSPRAVICEDELDPTVDLALLEKDLTKKLRFNGWQLAAYANIDGFQANGYGIMETVQALDNPGNIGRESVELGDFAFLSDTRDLQSVEMCARQYYFSRTKLLQLCGDPASPDPENDWSREQVDYIIATAPKNSDTVVSLGKDASLYQVMKVMFRVKGIVQVAWVWPEKCKDWLRAPRPLFIGRRKLSQSPQFVIAKMLSLGQLKLEDWAMQQIVQGRTPPSEAVYETEYPYFLYPYLISENNTIAQLKGRVWLDQDSQEGASSLLSSFVTKARRSAGLYGSRDVNDPNSDLLQQKNVFLRSGCIVDSKISFFELGGPDPALMNSVNAIISLNQAETSKVNFAETNRQNDSRKTATAVNAAQQMSQELSTVQVVLYSIANKEQFTYECDIIKSRVITGLITVNQSVLPQYFRKWSVKPSGDTDVIEKQKLIQTMLQTWPVVANTAAAPLFLSDLISLMFPNNAAKYLNAIQIAAQQAQSAQAQQMQQMIQVATQAAQGIIELSNHPDFFSDAGKLHALPVIEMAASKLEEIMKQAQKPPQTQPVPQLTQ